MTTTTKPIIRHPEAPATPKQISYLRSLFAQARLDWDPAIETWNRLVVSALIDSAKVKIAQERYAPVPVSTAFGDGLGALRDSCARRYSEWLNRAFPEGRDNHPEDVLAFEQGKAEGMTAHELRVLSQRYSVALDAMGRGASRDEAWARAMEPEWVEEAVANDCDIDAHLAARP